MPAPNIRGPWEEPVRQIVTDHPSWGRREVHQELILYAEAHGIPRVEIPSESTVGRIMAEFRHAGEDAHRGYERVEWPGSFGESDLPWEAGRAVLDLLAYLDAYGKPRPPLRLVRWYWRLTCAAPDAPIQNRLSEAIQLASTELRGESTSLPWREMYLAYAPWKGELDKELFISQCIRWIFEGKGFLASEGTGEAPREDGDSTGLRFMEDLFGRSQAVTAAYETLKVALEGWKEDYRKSHPEEVVAFEQGWSASQELDRDTSFLEQFRPTDDPGVGWRQRVLAEAKQRWQVEGSDEQTGK